MDIGEAMGLLSALLWVRDLNLVNMDFEIDSKVATDSIYSSSDGVSDFIAIINDCRHFLDTDLSNSDVKFIRRQANGVSHSIAKDAPWHASFQLYLNMPSCISTLFNKEKL